MIAAPSETDGNETALGALAFTPRWPREGGFAKRAHKTRDLRAGVVTRAPGESIHSLGNNAARGGETLVTLHVYSPPLGLSAPPAAKA